MAKQTWAVALLTLTMLGGATGWVRASSAAGTEPSLAAYELFAGDQCGGNAPEPSASFLKDSEELRDIAQISQKTEIASTAKAPALPEIDFNQYHAFLLSMGARPTAGYVLGLAKPAVHIENDAAGVRVLWTEPAPGMRAAQMLTSPCLVIAVPKGNYRRIRVLDQKDKTRFELSVP